MEQTTYPQDFSTTYPTAPSTRVPQEEQAPTLPNNVVAVIVFAALGVVAAVVTFIAARSRRKPKTARERLMELVENGRAFGAQLADQVKTGVLDGIERIRSR